MRNDIPTPSEQTPPMFTVSKNLSYLLLRQCALAALTLVSGGGPAALAAPVTVRQQTCAQAQNQVIRTGRYYKDSADGPLPIFGLIPVNEPFPSCLVHQRLFYLRERTRDSAACLVAFTCIAF